MRSLTISFTRQQNATVIDAEGSVTMAIPVVETRIIAASAPGEPSFAEKFAARLRVLRWAAGLSQAEMAQRAGISTQLISKYESGSCAISVSRLPKLAAALGLADVAALFEFDPAVTQRHVVYVRKIALMRNFEAMPEALQEAVLAFLRTAAP